MKTRVTWLAVLSCSSFVGAAHAQFGLSVDLRATSVNGAPLGAGQSAHAITNALVGDVITFDVFAMITGTDALISNDRLNSFLGSYKSVPVSGEPLLFGNLLMDVRRTTYDSNGEPTDAFGFDQIGHSIGLQQDLDGDGDLDVGSNFPQEPEHFWAVRSMTAPTGVTAPPPVGRKVGLGTFTVTSSSGSTLVNFFGRNHALGSHFIQDGNSVLSPTFDAPPQNGILVSAVPEPVTSLAVGALGALGVCGRRRRRR